MDNYLRNHLTYYLKKHVQILENYEKLEKDIKILYKSNILTDIKDLDDIILDYKKDLDNYEKERKISIKEKLPGDYICRIMNTIPILLYFTKRNTNTLSLIISIFVIILF